MIYSFMQSATKSIEPFLPFAFFHATFSPLSLEIIIGLTPNRFPKNAFDAFTLPALESYVKFSVVPNCNTDNLLFSMYSAISSIVLPSSRIKDALMHIRP